MTTALTVEDLPSHLAPLVETMSGLYPGSKPDLTVRQPGCGSPEHAVGFVNIDVFDETDSRTDRYGDPIPVVSLRLCVLGSGYLVEVELGVSLLRGGQEGEVRTSSSYRDLGGTTLADLVSGLAESYAQVRAQAGQQQWLDTQVNDRHGDRFFDRRWLRRTPEAVMVITGGRVEAVLHPSQPQFGVTAYSEIAGVLLDVAPRQRDGVVEQIGRLLLMDTDHFDLIDGEAPGTRFLDRILAPLRMNWPENEPVCARSSSTTTPARDLASRAGC